MPRKFLGRTTLWPREGGARLWLRLLFEMELPRYLIALSPFVIAIFVWRDHALAIAQAPIPMLILIYLVEARFLRAGPSQRARLIGPDDADRALDLLRARARSILTRIAAARGLVAGRLHLVIEQSDLMRVPVLTLVSVQSEDGPTLLNLSPTERALIAETLFAAPLSERLLQHVGIARKIELHDLTLEPAQVSAHARLAAARAARATEAKQPVADGSARK
ncbi:hypothetical protein [Pararhodobacter sp. SW119]|uniref:hypothetical protein n=1 Tax=Pararhodobacter sp. SW119 TaxID=2780075 RepID=UPI001FD7DC45|nr:hypothetical protein [Pararhodobacter sp. SW119]